MKSLIRDCDSCTEVILPSPSSYLYILFSVCGMNLSFYSSQQLLEEEKEWFGGGLDCK